jgi:chitodextrinase
VPPQFHGLLHPLKPGSSKRNALVVVAACVFGLIALPSTVFAQGQPVELKGKVVYMHGDDFSHRRAVGEGYYLQGAGRLDQLPGSAAAYLGQTVTARGEVRDGRTVLTEVAAAGGTGTSSGTATASATVSGTKRVAVILFNFSNDTSQPFTPASVAQTYFSTGATDRSVANYYNEVSWGQIQVTGQALGWYTIPATNQTCDPATWSTQADQAAQAAGVNLSAYDVKTYVYPGVGLCGWGGLAQMPGTQNWINGSPSVGIMSHELGHNFGLNHASSETCTLANGDRVAYSSTCTASEYGDPWDVMGASSTANHLNEWHLAMLGLTSDIQTVSADGTYALSPVETQSGSPHALRVPRGDGTYFDLEYRQPYGIFDAFSGASAAVNGVMVRKISSYSTANKPMLIDTTPETASFADAALAAGKTFVDLTTGITVTTLSVSSTGAQVQVSFGGGDFVPPNVAISSPTDGGSATLPTTVAVSATDNVGVARVELYRAGTLLGTDTSAPYTFSWVNGQSGPYTLTAIAYDTSGISSVSPAVTVNATQSDTAAPTVPAAFWSTANLQTSIATTWTASTDNVAVAYYELYLNGTRVATPSGTSYTFAALTCGGSYTLSISAVDAAGNKSPRFGISAWTTACSGDTQAPTMPTGVQATATGPTTVQLSWQPSTDNVGISFYRVDRDGVTVTHASSTSFANSGLVAGTTYRYMVTAYDAAGNASGTSDPVSVTTPTTTADTQAPSTPTGLQVGATSSTTVALSWQASTDNVGVAGYRVFRNGTQVAQTTSTAYTDSGLTGATTYTYTVSAYDAAGNVSATSSPVNVATKSASVIDTQAPTPPGNLQATALNGNKLSLAWLAATDNVGVTAYWIYRDGQRVGVVTSLVTLAYTDNPGRGTHTYYVLSVDAAGNQSLPSNTVSAS